MQQEIPAEKLSRLYSYDALGSWVLMPIAYVVVGPIAAAVGTRATLIGCAILVARSDGTRPALARRAHARAPLDGACRAGAGRRGLALAQDVAARDLGERHHDDLVDVHVRRARQREEHAVGDVLGRDRAAHRHVRVDRLARLLVALKRTAEKFVSTMPAAMFVTEPACPAGRRAAHACSRAPRTSKRRTTSRSTYDQMPATEPMLTMWPPSPSTRAGRQRRVMRIRPSTFVSITWRSSSSLDSQTGSRPSASPALLTRMSRPPSSASARSTNARAALRVGDVEVAVAARAARRRGRRPLRAPAPSRRRSRSRRR